MDCCHRILPVLEQLETSQEHFLVIAHQAILRCIVTYFLKGDLNQLPFLKIPQHCLMKITYMNGENFIEFIRTPVDHIEQGIVQSILMGVPAATGESPTPVIV